MLEFQHQTYNGGLFTIIRDNFIYTTLRVRSSKKLFTPSQYNGVWENSTIIKMGGNYV